VGPRVLSTNLRQRSNKNKKKKKTKILCRVSCVWVLVWVWVGLGKLWGLFRRGEGGLCPGQPTKLGWRRGDGWGSQNTKGFLKRRGTGGSGLYVRGNLYGIQQMSTYPSNQKTRTLNYLWGLQDSRKSGTIGKGLTANSSKRTRSATLHQRKKKEKKTPRRKKKTKENPQKKKKKQKKKKHKKKSTALQQNTHRTKGEKKKQTANKKQDAPARDNYLSHVGHRGTGLAYSTKQSHVRQPVMRKSAREISIPINKGGGWGGGGGGVWGWETNWGGGGHIP